MPLPLPEVPENRAVEFARNVVLRYNQAEEAVGREYIATFEQAWGVAELGKGSIHTQQQMQDIINAMPQTTAIALLQSGRKFVENYGIALPEHYRQPAWDFTLHNGNTIVIGNLRPEWQVVSDEVI